MQTNKSQLINKTLIHGITLLNTAEQILTLE